MSNSIVSILQSVILLHSDFEFEQVVAFEFFRYVIFNIISKVLVLSSVILQQIGLLKTHKKHIYSLLKTHSGCSKQFCFSARIFLVDKQRL